MVRLQSLAHQLKVPAGTLTYVKFRKRGGMGGSSEVRPASEGINNGFSTFNEGIIPSSKAGLPQRKPLSQTARITNREEVTPAH